MKQITLFIIAFILCNIGYSQHSESATQVLDSSGCTPPSYALVYTPRSVDTLEVIFVFENSNCSRAITLRQEAMNNEIIWLSMESGTVTFDGLVVNAVSHVADNQTIVWKYLVANSKKKKKIQLEPAALLIMESDFKTEKIWL